MMRKLFTTLTVVLVGCALSMAQTGALKVTLTDGKTNETLPFVPVVVFQNGQQAGVGTTNIDGEVIIKPLTPGKYDVQVKYLGYQPVQMTGVIVSADKTAYVPVKMSTNIVNLNVVEKVEYLEPLIDPDTKSGGTITREEYQNMPSKNINSVAATTAGVYQKDEGKGLNMRGARENGTSTYIDGVKVIGTAGLPEASVEQVSVVTGGVPASYGDATGGIVSVTTRGPQTDYFGGIHAASSQFLDAFGYNYLGLSIGGPILLKKDSTGMKKSVLGFIFSGDGFIEKDPNPSSVGVWKVNPDVLSELEQNPLRPSSIGAGYVRNTEFVTKDDMTHIKARQNVQKNSLRLNGKIDYFPTTNLRFTLGGYIDHYDQHDYVHEYALFNPVNNPKRTGNTWNLFGRLTQKFGSATAKEEEKSSTNIKNAFYTLQVGYSHESVTVEDDDHEDNIFNYGYIGKFTQTKGAAYGLRSGSQGLAYYQTGYTDELLSFERREINPLGANWTEQLYELSGGTNNGGVWTAPDEIETPADIQNGQGLLNGDRPQNIYSLWYNTGRQYGGTSLSDNSQVGIRTSFSADIKNHAIQIGFEYEQRAYRGYSTGAIALWTLMRQLANFHIAEMDTANPIENTALSGTYKYYDFNRKYDAASQKQFDKSLREKLGKPVNGTEWLDIDAMDPSTFSLDMFSADDLLNDGNALIGYYGYDYTGKRLTKNPSLDDFFNAKDDKGNFSRQVGAFQPIYVAGYIQDKFDFRDLKFNVGLRIDRYDANQPVLKDMYLLHEAKTAAEVTNFGAHPANIGDDYVVYVNDINNPTAIVGYRSGDKWYNKDGSEQPDPAVFAAAAGGKIAPYLVDPNNKEVSTKAFKDYDPQINFMPRIAFSFPISDVANFFAHYDVLTQRPSEGLSGRMDPTGYLFLESIQGAVLNNPDLKPVRTTDYELGFSQTLNERKNSAITLSAFYRELRNNIQIINVNYAYPVTYKTYGNIDFGTVKGFTAAYDLRRTGNVQLTASYTLQFADGTGSSATDGFSLLNAGLPNLRTTIPLSYDQRHTIVTNVDYRFGSGKEYRGPVWKKGEKTIQLLSNVGANLLFRAGSGTPYTKQGNVTGDVLVGVSQRSTLKGSINGANLPWQYRFDLRVNKTLELKWGKGEGEDKKVANLDIYVQVLNLLNTQNVLAVYHATGNADDDGYLADATNQALIAGQNSPTSFIDLYSIKVNNPDNYSIPRRIRLGIELNF